MYSLALQGCSCRYPLRRRYIFYFPASAKVIKDFISALFEKDLLERRKLSIYYQPRGAEDVVLHDLAHVSDLLNFRLDTQFLHGFPSSLFKGENIRRNLFPES